MLILYVIFFGCWFYLNNRKHGFNISTFLLSLYAVSSLLSLVLLYGYDEFDEGRINGIAVIYHIACYFLFMSPLVLFGNRFKIDKVDFPSFKIIKIVIYFIITLSLCSLIVSIPKMLFSFSFQELSEARKLHNRRELFEESNVGALEYLGSLGAALSYYSLFFFFYIFSYFKKERLLWILLFISSFSVVISNLAIMGRDGVIRWILFFVSLYLLFQNVLSRKTKKIILRISMIPLSIFLLVFSLISFSRFGDRNNDTLYYLISYAGQQNIYFSYNFENFIDGIADGKMNFSYFFNERVSINNLNSLVYADYNLNTFSSFVGSFYMDMGLIKTFLLAAIFFIFNTLFLNRINFYKSIYFLIVYEVVLLGLFYYMHYSPTKVNTLTLLFLLSYGIYLYSRIQRNRVPVR